VRVIFFFLPIHHLEHEQKRTENQKESADDSLSPLPKDLLQVLIEAKDPETGMKLSQTELYNEVMTFYLAGFETTSITLVWFFYLLHHHPYVEQKVLEEIDRVIGRNEEITFENVKNLKYLGMCLDETLRLYPPATVITREVQRDVELIKDIFIPKDSVLAFNVWCIHHNPNYWNEPEKFEPERFSEENMKNIKPYSYLPFGLGPHICIGQKFALTEAKIVAAKILQKFTLKIVNENDVEKNDFFIC